MQAECEIDMDKIIDRIYLGSAFAAQDTDSLTRLGITHVLTIDTQPLKYDLSENITYKYIYCVDMPEADLLTKFEECFKFIDDGLSQENGAVLIHCLAGVSRSATVLTAYLMYRHNMCLYDALGTIKGHRPRIRPNPGFMRQLELFEEMGSNVDPGNDVLRKYKLGRMADKMQAGSIEEFPSEDLLANPNEALNKSDSYFKCRKCRQPLFRSSGIMTHTVGQGEAAFDWRSKVHSSKSVEQSEDRLCAQSLFIEPVQWMAESINQLDGKILCPKCHAKLGSFIWYGEKCPCGAWVAPAFHIQKSKVDEVMTSQLSANQTQPRSQVIEGRQDFPGLVALACSSETLADKHDSSSAISCAVNGKPNGGKDTILDEILHPRRAEDIS